MENSASNNNQDNQTNAVSEHQNSEEIARLQQTITTLINKNRQAEFHLLSRLSKAMTTIEQQNNEINRKNELIESLQTEIRHGAEISNFIQMMAETYEKGTQGPM